MAHTVVGLFDSFDEAQSVVSDLQSQGFNRNDISLIANDASGQYAKTYSSGGDKMDKNAAEKAGSGAVAGTATGAGLGLLVGLGALAIPGIGPILAAGPLAAALGAGAATVAGSAAIGAGLGAASGALVGPLTDAGIPRPEAEMYNEGVRRGGTLVTVKADDEAMAQQAQNVMSRYNVVDIDHRGEMYSGGGWKYDQGAQPYTNDQVTSFRSAYTTGQPVTATDTNRDVVNRMAATGEDQVLRVIEEELQIGKRSVSRGGQRVRTYITERSVEEQVTLRDETIHVERRPASGDANIDATNLFKEQTFEVTETDEEAVVAKRARVIEEVVIRKDVTDRTETIRDTVRRQDVDVQDIGATTVSDTTTTNTLTDNTTVGSGVATTDRTVGASGFESYDADFRKHYQSSYANSGLDYNSYGPVYRYGYNLASDDRYNSSDWNTVETGARTRWEERNPGTWDQFKDGIHYAWDRARGRA